MVVRVIADRIFTRIPMLFIFKAGQNCGEAQFAWHRDCTLLGEESSISSHAQAHG
jgi:hypothetical protein